MLGFIINVHFYYCSAASLLFCFYVGFGESNLMLIYFLLPLLPVFTLVHSSKWSWCGHYETALCYFILKKDIYWMPTVVMDLIFEISLNISEKYICVYIFKLFNLRQLDILNLNWHPTPPVFSVYTGKVWLYNILGIYMYTSLIFKTAQFQ